MPQAPKEADPLLISYLDAIVALTCQREAHGLTASLIDSLCQHVQAERFRLLAVSHLNNDSDFDENNIQGAVVRDWLDPLSTPIPIRHDKDLLACARTKDRISRKIPVTGGRRLVLPILGVSNVTALLVIEGMRELGSEDGVLARLVQIFSNQLYLLSRNELDGLTGLYNRQSFDERIKHLVLNAGHDERRARSSVAAPHNCLALLDIDHFKMVNDRYGHLYGDEVLVQFARLMSHSFRHQDMMFRYGGEEFALVLVGMTSEAAVPALEFFRLSLEAYEFPQIGCKTVSIGVAGISPGESVDTIINRADKAMYHAKQNGRNQVCCYETLVARGKLAPVSVITGDIELF
ncbi:MAG: GGDEF domain-containing protein [Sulfuricaulis sp.]|uniref:GGDEF domain-containing protein n=1 Tax=Sulfuricaulis sp. TaxID=2003553 RepID=UPI0025F4048A|nr:GGDEF domain-containing protein [Sulfuricaulis sp.]MCR4348094.1 GGDEF domain-containing protein [Sulfuricaulis sp.]